MIKLLSRLSVHPWTIAFLNAGFLILTVQALYDLVVTHATPHPEAEEIISGVGVLMIAWGVALEERHKLREVFGLVSGEDAEESPHDSYEAAMDENCHRYGLGLLLLGLFAEVGVECVKMPDRIVNTHNIESEVLLFSASLLAVAGILLLRQIIFLLFTSKKNFQRSSHAAKTAGH